MSGKMAFSIAKKNLWANRLIVVPFLLSSGFMSILYYILVSLLQNRYVQTRHISLPILMTFAVIIVGVFTFIFINYANQFLMKRRKKELALYTILGLEKKHIAKILAFETFIIYLFILFGAIIGGHIFGKLSFWSLNRLIGGERIPLMEYPISAKTIFIVGIFLSLLFLEIFMVNIGKVNVVRPKMLLDSQKKGEAEPKSRRIFTFMGLLLLGAGYYIAMTEEGTLKSLAMFFVAALLVMFATYILFISASIIVLKLLKKNKKYYYKAKNFLSVSGMLYRMKSNGVGLAGICVLSTGIILTLAVTFSIFQNMEAMVDSVINKEYSMTLEIPKEDMENKEKRDDFLDRWTDYIQTSVPGGEIENLSKEVSSQQMVRKEKNEIKAITQDEGGSLAYVIIKSLDTYNENAKTKESLQPDQILLCASNQKDNNETALVMGGKTWKPKVVESILPANIAVDTYLLVLPSQEDVEYLSKALSMDDKAFYTVRWQWDAKGEGEGYLETLRKDVLGKVSKDSLDLESKDSYRKSVYEINGGFLFLGVIIGLLFLVGTVLITYYKQISEAYEDRRQYQIMKEIGLPDTLIKKATRSQILWLFFLPVAVAAVHALVASRVVSHFLRLFGIFELKEFLYPLMGVLICFILVYGMVFIITSKIYYKLVK
ncbi:MAG TPA: ABC transporter permease [Lachnospiraceae bacterium]